MEARGIGEQAGRLRAAVERLVGAHVELARAELSEIAGELGRVAGWLGLALAVLLAAGLLVLVGLPLLLGEWLFGSLGWGILHGVLLGLAVAATAVVAALGARPTVVWLSLLAGGLSATVIGLLLGLDLASRGAAELARRAASDFGVTLPSGWENAIAGAVAGAAVGALLLLVVAGAWRRTAGAVLRGLVVGLLLGGILGAIFGSVRFGAPVGAAIGLAIGLLVWIAAMAAGATSIDFAARFERFKPTTTIETTRETLEWVRGRIRPASR